MSKRELEVLRAIRNYLAHHSKVPSYRQLGRELGYKSSPNRVAYFVKRLEDKGYVSTDKGDIKINFNVAEEQLDKFDNIETVEIPLLGTIPCGPTIAAEECVEGTLRVSTNIAKRGSQYFLLRAKGDSMNLAGINEGDILLIRSQVTADNNDRVVALVDNEVTLKEFQRTNGVNMLLPRSTNDKNKPIIISENCSVQGVVIKVFPGDIFTK